MNNTTILLHNIEYSWKHDEKENRELSETDIEHIEKMIKEGYNQGELCQYDYDLDKEIYGWWQIS